jgi:hypothetical protein
MGKVDISIPKEEIEESMEGLDQSKTKTQQGKHKILYLQAWHPEHMVT